MAASTDPITENGLPPLPSSLTDGRATQRLLNALDRLEAFHANLAAANGPDFQGQGGIRNGTAITSELTQLRQENKQLRLRQRHAIERLDVLLERIPHLAPDASPEAETEEAA